MHFNKVVLPCSCLNDCVCEELTSKGEGYVLCSSVRRYL